MSSIAFRYLPVFASFRSVCLALFLLTGNSVPGADPTGEVGFNRDIRPLLSDKCFQCHGPDARTRKADLRLDRPPPALVESGRPLLVPGRPSESELIRRVRTVDPDDRMPPPETGHTLAEAEIRLLERWIEQGAVYQDHWAFIPVERPEPPASRFEDRVRNGIDAFVFRRLEREGLEPSPEAGRTTLLRRAALDLTGLPPSPELMGAFLADERPGAYERAVDALLASPHYGERMALVWLDAARYADTSGYQADWERFMWPWRDWVIEAYNRNLPFDQFTIEQLAGDLLPHPTYDQKLATGFNRNHRINDEGGVIAAEYLVEYVVDRVDTTATVWLGLTMGCARCHDHKYDPLTMEDFYRMFATFHNVPEKGKDGRRGYGEPALDHVIPDVERELIPRRARLAALEREYRAEPPEIVSARGDWIQAMSKRLREREARGDWVGMKIREVQGTGGVQFEHLEDDSYLTVGPNPDHPVYTLRGRSPLSRISAVRLEALTHPKLTEGSLARSSNGNFVLTEVELLLRRPDCTNAVSLAFAQSGADYSQSGYPVANAVDGKKETGWGAEGNKRRENRTALFVLKEPLELQGEEELVLQLRHESRFAKHAIGRFRVSLTDVSKPSMEAAGGVPPELVKALKMAKPDAQARRVMDDAFRVASPLLARLRQEREALRKTVKALEDRRTVKVMVMEEMETPRETFVLSRGQYDQPDPGRPVTPDAPAVFGGLGEGLPRNRLGLAQWIVNPANPLTARVAVNRYWQMYFGRGLVATPEDFGSQGSRPSHPDLLDWLASEFVRLNWDIKALQRLIVTSATYRQSSRVTPGRLERDPDNRLLSRGPRFRLSGAELRDQALAASGLLVRTQGGPSVKPYQPPGLWAEVSFQSKDRSTDFYEQDHGDKLYRRSLYTFWKRSVAPPMLVNFDAATREACAVRLVRTSTPLQALNLMNDVTFVEASRHLGARMLRDGGSTTEERIRHGFYRLGLQPAAEDVALLVDGLVRHLKYFQERTVEARELVSMGESPVDPAFSVADLAAYTATAMTLLNLDMAQTKE